MGTRGLYGFYYKGRFYLVYKHSDAYPDGSAGLGTQIAREIVEVGSDGIARWREAFDRETIVFVQEEGSRSPTEQEIEHLAPYADTSVGTQSMSDWYVLLRRCQGSLRCVMESGYLLNAVGEDNKPGWQEYAYVVNLDTMALDYYEYRTLVASIPLPGVTLDTFTWDNVKAMRKAYKAAHPAGTESDSESDDDGTIDNKEEEQGEGEAGNAEQASAV